MGKDFKATIRKDSERAPAWLEVFESLEIPLQSPIPVLGGAPGVTQGYFYMLDLQDITEEQRTRLIACLARKFGIDVQEVAETLDSVGCPILDEDVTITVFNPMRWL